MAFPTIQTADTKNGTQTSNSTSWTLTYPTNLASGDLIMAFVATDGDVTGVTTFPNLWTGNKATDGGAAVSCLWAVKKSDGTETGNFTVTMSASEQGSWRVFRITDWFGELTSGDGSLSVSSSFDNNSLSMLRALDAGTSANPDPPNLNPFNWATEDTLWFAACFVDTSRTISVWPLANNQTSDVSGGAGGATLGLCTINSAVASLDPGTFTISTSDDWIAATVAVRPAAAAAVVVTRDPWPALQAVNRSNVY